MTVDPRLLQAMLNGAFDTPDPNVSEEERAAMLVRERQLAPLRQRIANEAQATDSFFDRLRGARQLGSNRNMRTIQGLDATPGDVGFQASMINSAEIDQQRAAANPMVDALSPLQASPRRAKLVEALLAQRPAERDPTVASPTLERTFGPRGKNAGDQETKHIGAGPFSGKTDVIRDSSAPQGLRLVTNYDDRNAKDAALAEIIAKRRAAGKSFEAAQQARRSTAFANRREDAREARKAQAEAVANNPLAGMNPRMLAGMNPRLAEALIGGAAAMQQANVTSKTQREIAANKAKADAEEGQANRASNERIAITQFGNRPDPGLDERQANAMNWLSGRKKELESVPPAKRTPQQEASLIEIDRQLRSLEAQLLRSVIPQARSNEARPDGEPDSDADDVRAIPMQGRVTDAGKPVPEVSTPYFGNSWGTPAGSNPEPVAVKKQRLKEVFDSLNQLNAH